MIDTAIDSGYGTPRIVYPSGKPLPKTARQEKKQRHRQNQRLVSMLEIIGKQSSVYDFVSQPGHFVPLQRMRQHRMPHRTGADSLWESRRACRN